MSTADKEKNFVLNLFDIIPSLTIPCVATVPHNLIFEREENYISYYNDYFFVEKGIFYINLLYKETFKNTLILLVKIL